MICPCRYPLPRAGTDTDFLRKKLFSGFLPSERPLTPFMSPERECLKKQSETHVLLQTLRYLKNCNAKAAGLCRMLVQIYCIEGLVLPDQSLIMYSAIRL